MPVKSILFLLLFFYVPCLGQEQPGYEQLADTYFRTWRFSKAAPIYERLARSKKAKPLVYYRLGYSYESLQKYPEAIAAYTGCVEKDPSADSLLVRIGDIQKMLGQYDAAKNSYGQYKGRRDLRNRIAGCDSAMQWTTPGRIRLQNLDAVNSTYSDWGAFREKGKLYYTSNFNRLEPTSQKVSGQTGEPYFRVFQLSNPEGSPGRLNIDNLASVIDVSKYHIGPACYHGDSVYFTVSREGRLKMEKEDGKKIGTRRLELYISDGEKPAYPFPYNNAEEWSTGHAAITGDGNILYFVSDRPGGQGGADIWFCLRDTSGGWLAPRNCGAVINTPDDELFPVLGPDGNLYIASRGHTGIGGLDIFRVTGAMDQWNEPVNMRPPLNSSYDDFYFVSADSVSGYLASNRPGGKGSDDIYIFVRQASPVEPPAASIPPPNRVKPKPGVPQPDEVFILTNLYYDFDKSYIRSPDATAVLDSLASVLIRYPEIKIMLSAHTDSRGSDSYNMSLSRKRADAAVQYLVTKGISNERMTARGYGESRLVNHCLNGVKCAEADHQANRRTEITVTRKKENTDF
ncbi:OmpA family protein [Chitinophaga sp. ARDCPP14]|uniref:OmpA family protein n=1 Tax=Chitinophaga sp. ARDCPP14 TaxID=3391139 RepID=UPI003F525C11